MSVSNHQPEFDEEDLLDIEPEEEDAPPAVATSKRKSKGQKKKNKKRSAEPDSAPAPVVEEPEPVKKRKVFDEHKLKGDRLALIPSYRHKLAKNREKNAKKRSAAAGGGGGNPIPERKKLKAGTVAKLESNYLQDTNGLLLPYALVRRQVIRESADIIRELTDINVGVGKRMYARGKEAPASLVMKEPKQWHFSSNAVELVRAAAQARLENVAEAASDMRRKTGRVTVMGSDITDAVRFLDKFSSLSK